MRTLALDVETFLELPLAELGRLTGIGRSTWSQWFSGQREPRQDLKTKAANKLGMEYDEFWEAFQKRRDRVKAEKTRKK